MNIAKETQVNEAGTPTKAQLEAINAQAKSQLAEDQVYVFSLRLCDNQIDRDYERFDTQALPELARLFLGKTGIIDHNWSSQQQVARIFASEVVQEGDLSYIKAWAYIRRGGSCDQVIADIEAGIKKEVSVGCAMGRSVCSVCGSDYGTCGHQKGEVYDGQVCCAVLKEPMDAYEFSFVAVPAQREAGVLKGFGGSGVRLKELADRFGAQEEYRLLWKQAQLGQQYEKQLQQEIVRLCLSIGLDMDAPSLQKLAAKAGADELLRLKEALEQQLARVIPVQSQLLTESHRQESIESGFLI